MVFLRGVSFPFEITKLGLFYWVEFNSNLSANTLKRKVKSSSLSLPSILVKTKKAARYAQCGYLDVELTLIKS